MKWLQLFFDAAHPLAREVFDQLPQRLAGHAFECRYLPVQAGGLEDGDTLLRHAWACTAPGRSPSRWSSEQLLREATATTPDWSAFVTQRDPCSADVEADLHAARASLPVTLDGIALNAEGQWFVGNVGWDTWCTGLTAPDKP
jgi:hypothetical protein